MVNSDERLKILAMVEEHKISVEEGSRLLEALNAPRKPEPAVLANPAGGGPRWFHVKVTDTLTGRTKTTVNLPLSLVDWGLKIGAHFTPELNEMNAADIGQMLRSGVEGKIVEVFDEEDGEHVEIFVD